VHTAASVTDRKGTLRHKIDIERERLKDEGLEFSLSQMVRRLVQLGLSAPQAISRRKH
jgi:hypothetical protein